jgi:hypothetical protein
MGIPRVVRELKHLELIGRQSRQGLPDLLALEVAPGLGNASLGCVVEAVASTLSWTLRRLAVERS